MGTVQNCTQNDFLCHFKGCGKLRYFEVYGKMISIAHFFGTVILEMLTLFHKKTFITVFNKK